MPPVSAAPYPDAAVDEFVEALGHPLEREVQELRRIVGTAAPGLTEHVKWNAPSYGYEGEDRVTFRLRPQRDRIDLIFHRGVAVKDSTGFEFDDRGLLTWAAPDRGSIAFSSLSEVQEREPDVRDLVRRWIET